MALRVKNLSAMKETQEMWVWSLGWEDLLEKEMATHSSILAWRILWTEKPSRLRSMGSQRVGHDWETFSFFLSLTSQFFASGGQSIGASVSASVLRNIQGWFPLRLTGLISLQSKELSRIFFNTTVWKYQFFGAQTSLWSNSHIYTWLLEKP